MARTVVLGFVILLGAAFSVPMLGAEDQLFGKGLTLDSSIPIGELIADPVGHAGRTLRVDGVVTEICREHGDWFKLSGPRGGSGLLVEFTAPADRLPVDCGGKRISVEGLLEAAPAADGTGGDADEKRVCPAMTRGTERYRLRATGAILYGR